MSPSGYSAVDTAEGTLPLGLSGLQVRVAVATAVRNAVVRAHRRRHDRTYRGSRRHQSPELVAFERFSSLRFWKRPGLRLEGPECRCCVLLLSFFLSLLLSCLSSLFSLFSRHGEFASFESYCCRS